jgi:autophagy-related protein 9
MLEKRFVICGIVSLIFCPLVMVCTVIYFIFRYGDEIKDRPGTILGLKQWSTLAKWKMRDINELPHLFEERLKNSQTAAQKYVGHFHLHKIGLLADFVAYSTGALIALIIIAELLEVNFIINLNFFGMNGIVWFGLLSGVLTISRGLRVKVRPSSQTINDSMMEMAEITHYLPDHWYGRAHTTHVRDEFNQLFTYTLRIWIIELISIITTPFVFLFKLPYCARDIIKFCRTKTEYFENIGYLSTFSMLDLEEFGSVGDEQRNIYENNIITEDYKINRSIINFAFQYPLWRTQEITGDVN